MNNKGMLLKKWAIVVVCCALIAFGIPFLTSSFMAENGNGGPVVIVLDPGHGGADVGAVNTINGLYEADANLAIALACYEELQRYDGIEVYMTHTGLDRSTTMSLTQRIDYVKAVGANMLISLHCNDASSNTANGSEVYVSHSTYKDSYNRDSTKLALEFLSEFRELGMNIRGVKTRLSGGGRVYYHDDGSVELGDYYAVIGGTIKKYGIPGMLVEHGFVTGDYRLLGSPESLKAFGVADAKAIVKYYGLSLKGEAPVTGSDEEAILLTDQDMISASDVNNSLMTLPETFGITDYDYLQQVRRSYEALSPAAKTLIQSADIDRLYHSILELNYQLYPVRIEALEESELTINRINATISGLNLATSNLSGTNVSSLLSLITPYVDTRYAAAWQTDTSGLALSVVDRNGYIMDIGESLGTGCRLQLRRGLDLVDELVVVIACDLSGDGKADSRDHLLLEDYLDGLIKLDYPAMLAADVNFDGVVDESDLKALLYQIVE